MCYERRCHLITANQPFSAWDSIFPEPAMTVAAIDRLATIFELNVESYRRRAATRATTIINDIQNHGERESGCPHPTTSRSRISRPDLPATTTTDRPS